MFYRMGIRRTLVSWTGNLQQKVRSLPEIPCRRFSRRETCVLAHTPAIVSGCPFGSADETVRSQWRDGTWLWVGRLKSKLFKLAFGFVERHLRTGWKNVSLNASVPLSVWRACGEASCVAPSAHKHCPSVFSMPALETQWDVCLHSSHWDRQRLWIRRQYNSTASMCNSTESGTHSERHPLIHKGRKWCVNRQSGIYYTQKDRFSIIFYLKSLKSSGLFCFLEEIH